MEHDPADDLAKDVERLRHIKHETIPISGITELDRLYDRVMGVNIVFANLVGVNASTLDWCPNHQPPTRDECIAWLWVQRPHWSQRVLAQADEPLLAEVVANYIRGVRGLC